MERTGENAQEKGCSDKGRANARARGARGPTAGQNGWRAERKERMREQGK
jgi:hypothetical protein